jgi:hypothetical protein
MRETFQAAKGIGIAVLRLEDYLASKVFGKAALTWNTKFFREFCFYAGYRFDFHWYINQAR